MNISIISKDYSRIPLSETKGALRIDSDDNTYDLTSYIESAVQASEAFINCNIARTVSLITDYNVCGQCYEINHPNVIVSGITGTSNGVSTVITGYSVYYNTNSTMIKFSTSINTDTLQIVYASGYLNSIPASIRHAIYIKTAELLDQSTTWQSTTLQNTRTWERLLYPHIRVRH